MHFRKLLWIARFLARVLFWILLVSGSLLLTLYLLLEYTHLGTYSATKLSAWLERNYGVNITIQRLSVKLPASVELQQTLVYDLRGDTLLWASRASTSLVGLAQGGHNLRFGRTELHGACLNLKTDSAGVINLLALIDRFKSNPPKKQKNAFRLSIERILFSDLRFSMTRENGDEIPGRFSPQNMDFQKIDGLIKYLQVMGDSVRMDIANLTFRERSGFEAEEFHTRMMLCPHYMHFQDIRLKARNQDLQVANFRMSYENWNSMKDFVNQVSLQLEILPSVITPRLLSYFVPLPAATDFPFYVSGNAKGTVASLHIPSLSVHAADATLLALQANFDGLPKVHDAVVNVSVKEFTTSLADVHQIVNALGLAHFNLPDFARQVNNLTYKGELVGFLDDFVAYGRITSDLGDIGVDLSLRIEENAATYFEGRVATKRLHVGKLLDYKELGRTDLTASISGSMSRNAGLKSQARMTINNLEFRNYTYRNIEGDGHFTPKSYTGDIAVHDSAFRFNFHGSVDFSLPVPKFQFAARADRIDLKKIHWQNNDSIAQLAFDVSAFFEGRKIDDLLGNIAFAQLAYTNSNGTAHLDGLRLTAFNEGGGKYITAEATPFYLSLWTDRRYDRFVPSMRMMLTERLPAFFLNEKNKKGKKVLSIPKDEFREHVVYRASLITGDSDELLQVFFPQMSLAPRSELRFEYNATTRALALQLKSGHLAYNNLEADDIDLAVQNRDTTAELKLSIRKNEISSLVLDSIALQSTLTADRLRTTLGIQTHEVGGGKLFLDTETQFYASNNEQPTRAVLRVLPSFFQLQERKWDLSRGRIYADTASLEVLNMSARYQDNRFSLAGRLSKYDNDTLRLALDNIDLTPLAALLPQYKLSGTINGSIGIASPLAPLNLLGQLQLSNFAINDTHVGNSVLAVRWAGIENPFLLHFENRQASGQRDIALNAAWSLQGKGFEGTLQLDRCKLQLLDLFTQEALASQGYVSANLNIRGSVQKPILQGEVAFDEAQFTLKQFKTQILTTDKLSLQNSVIYFNNFQAKDLDDHPLSVNGEIDISNITQPHFDLAVISQDFHALNTPASTELYYGQLFVSSQTKVRGTLNDLTLEVALRTESGTQLYFQLPSYSEAKENKLIEFVQPLETTEKVKKKNLPKKKDKPSALNFIIDLNVTNDALTQLLVNPRTGDVLRCRGAGQLRIENEVKTNQLRIFGDYTIQRGEYTFILQGLLSKKFKIQAGSVIRFSGAPENAVAQIEASYRVKASLDRLIAGDMAEKYKRRIPVDCKIVITGSLQAPRIQFKIDVPNADPETQGLFATALNTEEKVMRQFASLLLIGNFLSESRNEQVAQRIQSNKRDASSNTSGAQQGGNSDVLLSTFMELLFNNLNSWIAQIENAPSIDLGFNYRPGDAYTKDEAELSVSMQWFDGRLNVDANWDVNSANTSSAVAGDISVTQQSALLKNLQYKAFARSNDDLVFSDLSPYTAGAGIVVSDSFNSWKELLQRIKQLFTRKSKYKETLRVANEVEHDDDKQLEKETENESTDDNL